MISVVTGVVSEKVMLRIVERRVPQLDRDIAALQGREFGIHSVGDRDTGADRAA